MRPPIHVHAAAGGQILALEDTNPDEIHDFGEMMSNARDASAFLKALAHEGRLMILCHLASGEKSVTELERLLDSRQAAVSQQLARLRLEGLVDNRRDGKAIYYRIADDRVERMIATIHDMFCAPRKD